MNQILPQVSNCRIGKSYFIYRGHNSISYKGYSRTIQKIITLQGKRILESQ